MEMVSKMKPLQVSPLGSRIASVHNGSSLFTGDAGGGESNIRRYLIENDLLEAIIQLPNNIFYNTGITTYIWLLSNHKALHRQGKVQLIDAGPLYRKLRKNLGQKNCEFAPEHITAILDVYRDLAVVEREGEEGIASQVFDNRDFGYYKVTIERPSRLKAQFTADRVAELRFDARLREPMAWMWETFGEKVYNELSGFKKQVEEWCEKQDLDLSKKQFQFLLDQRKWRDRRQLMETAERLMGIIGQEVHNDFNQLTQIIDSVLKDQGVKPSASEKKTILQTVSWYDAKAEKVVKRVHKLKGDKLNQLLQHLGCAVDQLPDFGFYPGKKPGEYIEYDTQSDLRDTENVPLKDDIHAYFLREVKPHVDEAWINLDSTKIGYEISFNKYFYRHKPLRTLEDVSRDILQLEEESEGLIREILKMS
jgi:type I restriction enzyme M protein